MQRLPKIFVFLIAIFLVLNATVSLQAKEILPKFKQEDNFKYPEALSIFQDKQGLMWFGTDEGLVRYDGRNFDLYDKINGVDKISDVYAISQDSADNIWVGTLAGLCQFDRIEQKFTRYSNGDKKEVNTISAISQDNSEQFLIATLQGLYQFDPNTKKFTKFSLESSPEHVSTIYRDEKGLLWLGTFGQGLYTFDLKTKQLGKYPQDLGNLKIFSISAGTMGKEPVLWLGTDQGVVKINKNNQEITTPVCPKIIQEEKICYVHSVYQERSGVLFVGTARGLFKSWQGMDKFVSYQSDLRDAEHEHSLRSKDVRAMAEDSEGNIWVGTHLGGLTKITPEGKFEHFGKNEGLSNKITAVVVDNNTRILWVGTYDQGLCKFDLNSRESRCLNDKSIPNSIRAILLAKEGKIWIGTTESGLYSFDPKEGKSVNFSKDTKDLSDDRVTVIYQDADGTMWIGTKKGLNEYTKDGAFVTFSFTSLKDDEILSIQQQKNILQKNILWVGTEKGLVQFDLKEKLEVKRYLDNDKIQGILEDHENKLWLSTNKGLSRFDPETGQVIKNYDKESGLSVSGFNSGAYYKNSDGRMFFGNSGRGLVAFYPTDILTKNMYKPPVILTSLKINGKEQKINEVLEKGLEFKFSDLLEFECAALSYIEPENNQYQFSFKQSGSEDKWSEPNKNCSGRYTSSGGTYTLKIKGSNNDKLWNIIQVSAIIEPPLSGNIWFQSLLMVIGIALIYFVYIQFRSNKQIAKAKDEAESVAERLKQVNHELKRTKFELIKSMITLDFIHNLRNLAGIIPAYVELSKEEIGEIENHVNGKAKYFAKIQKYLDRIKERADDILNAVERSDDPLKIELVNVTQLLKVTCKNFHYQYYKEIVKERKISIVQEEIEDNLNFVSADGFLLRTALENIIANGMEELRSKEGGIMGIEAKNVTKGNQNWIQIAIKDTGGVFLRKIVKKYLSSQVLLKKENRGATVCGEQTF